MAWHLVTAFPRCRVTSGRRSVQENRAAGGMANSHHLTGRAVDLVGPPGYLEAVLDYVRTLSPAEALIHDAGSGRHLHVAW